MRNVSWKYGAEGDFAGGNKDAGLSQDGIYKVIGSSRIQKIWDLLGCTMCKTPKKFVEKQ
ncbi:hypothetical protein CE91St43_08150 [Oscillospiraceae bacterium]|nr:hypothetical protein CE91St43_08150 [Oscillospiraceae bacterium]